MQTIIPEIQKRLQDQEYKNEEHIRLSLVSRLLFELGWNIWDPGEFYPEYPVDKSLNVDIALFVNKYLPPIYIEIKSFTKLSTKGEIQRAEDQLRDYNKNLTALFTILTDGNEWRFYYSQAGGQFHEKCFKTIRLLTDNIEDIAVSFTKFLSKENISNNNAKDEAYELLQMTTRQRIIEENIPPARRLIIEHPEKSLVKLLQELLKDKGIEITEQEAIESLKKDSTPESPILIQSQKISTSKIQDVVFPSTSNLIRLDIDNLINLTHTSKVKGKIEDEEGQYWKGLLEIMVRKSIEKGIDKDAICKITSLNIQDGERTDSGYSPIQNTPFSLQGVDANKAAKSIIELAKLMNSKLYIEFVWQEKPGAKYPGKKGIIEM